MKSFVRVMSALAALSVSVQAFAVPSLPGKFKSFYAEKGIDVSPLASKACSLCHGGFFPNGGNLNDFGQDLQANVDVRSPVVDFTAIEEIDSDDDTFSNLSEFNAGTLPGDADSFPAAE